MNTASLNEWESTFIDFLDLTEFAIEKEEDYYYLNDLQCEGFFADCRFKKADEIFYCIENITKDFILAAIEKSFEQDKDNEKYEMPSSCSEWLDFMKNNPTHNISTIHPFEFKVCDMIVNHGKDINLEHFFED